MMESLSTRLSFLVLVAVLAACGGGSADESAPASTEAAQPSPAGAPQTGAVGSSTFADEHANYRLTMPVIRRWYEAQTAIYRAMGDNPSLADELETMNEASNVDELAAHFASVPEVRAAVRQAGLDTREYAAILIALMHARAVDAAIHSGADRAQVLAAQAVNPDNLALVEQNRAELDRLDRQLEALGEGMQ